MKRLVVFGGSFDPIHKGHIALSDAALRVVNADKLCFVPAGKHPFKNENSKINSAKIVNMLKLAIENLDNRDKFEIEPYELENFDSVSYTYDTLKYIKAKNPQSQIYLLIGADNLKDFKKWHRWDGILENADLIVGLRKSVLISDFRLYDFNFQVIDADAPNVSSSQLRHLLVQRRFEEANEYIYDNVLEYIKDENLYTP